VASESLTDNISVNAQGEYAVCAGEFKPDRTVGATMLPAGVRVQPETNTCGVPVARTRAAGHRGSMGNRGRKCMVVALDPM